MSHDDFFAELGIQRDGDAGSATDKPKSRKQRRMEKVERRQRKRRRHRLTSIVIVATLVAVGIVGYKAIGIMRDASAQATHAEDYRGRCASGWSTSGSPPSLLTGICTRPA